MINESSVALEATEESCIPPTHHSPLTPRPFSGDPMHFSRVLAVTALLLGPVTFRAQVYTSVIPGTKTGGSSNLHVLGHVPLDANGHTADITIEQELSRPYVYTAHRMTPSGIDIISVKDPVKSKLIYSWRLDHHEGNQDGCS